MKIAFYLRDKRKTKSDICLVITKLGLNYPLGKVVPSSQWSTKQHRLRETRVFPMSKKINRYLDAVQSEVQDFILDLELEKSMITRDKVKGFLNADRSDGSISQLLEAKIIRMQGQSKKAIAGVQIVKKYIDQFEESKPFILNLAGLQELRTLMERSSLSINSMARYFGVLKAVINESYELGLCKEIRFPKRFKIRPEKSDQIYLTKDEIKSIYECEILDEKLSRKRYFFVLQYCTGVRWGDLHKINDSRIRIKEGIEYFYVPTSKTGSDVAIPLHSYVKPIIEMNLKLDFSLSSYNLNLKQIARIAGVNGTFLKRGTKGGKMQETMFERWQLVSSHTARRSFCTNAYLADMKPYEIMQISGHKSLNTLITYIRLSNHELAKKASENPFWKG